MADKKKTTRRAADNKWKWMERETGSILGSADTDRPGYEGVPHHFSDCKGTAFWENSPNFFRENINISLVEKTFRKKPEKDLRP